MFRPSRRTGTGWSCPYLQLQSRADQDGGIETPLTPIKTTPIRSWHRFLQLKSGNDEIVILGQREPTKFRLIAEIDTREGKD
jgi:hypothetical protein